MTEELYGYVTVGIWLTMVAVAAAGLWPRRCGLDRERAAPVGQAGASRDEPAARP